MKRRIVERASGFIFLLALAFSLLAFPVRAEEDGALLSFAREVRELISLSERLPAPLSIEDGDFETSRLIVKAPGALETVGAPLGAAEGYGELHILQYATPGEAMDACARYQTMDGVLWAEPDRIVALGPEEEDPAQAAEEHLSWGYQSAWCGVDPYLDYIRQTCGGAPPEIAVAVADSGVFAGHNFLAGRVLPGYDFVNGTEDASDDHGHGSHVAGTIADGTLNNVKILPVKVLDYQGRGSAAQISLGIRYAADQGADVLNMSFNFPGASRITEEAVGYAVSKGVTTVVSAGNDGQPVAGKAPASFENVITVAAATQGDGTAPAAWPKSAYGPEVDVTAPGANIRSISHTDPAGCSVFKSGTSMAAPHVSAAAALVLTLHPDSAPESVRAMLVSACGDSRLALGSGADSLPGLLRFSSLLAREEAYPDGPIRIDTAQELLRFAGALDNGILPDCGRGREILLGADLDLGGVLWTPSRFAGVFDGQGHSISGLTVAAAASGSGFFSFLEKNAVVKNLRLVGLQAGTSGDSGAYLGGIAGYSEGSIQDCSVEGVVQALGTAGYVGGIAGYSAGSVTGCVFRGQISGGEYAGGVCGACRSLVNCVNEGTVSVSGSVSGGLAGKADSLRSCADLGAALAYYGLDRENDARVLLREDGTYYLSEPVLTGALDGGGVRTETGELMTALNRCAAASAGLRPWLQTGGELIPGSFLEGRDCLLLLAEYENGRMLACAPAALDSLAPVNENERRLFVLDPDSYAPLFRAMPL